MTAYIRRYQEVVKAWQIPHRANVQDIPAWVAELLIESKVHFVNGHLVIKESGDMVSFGDWLIRYPNGRLESWLDTLFKQSFQLLENPK